ncbi:hypothetical protein IWQ52_005704 [Labrenzia sp. EL_159]|nr:hypothetical protein [Labrenzia sp. EL_162]MBG6198154.1 hypothetical protein [Labrenzia sp. EL_159]
MAGTRTVRNRISRSKRRKIRTSAARPSTGNPYKNLIITSVITILIGAVFGDLIVKKNIQTYNSQHTAFISSPEDGDEAFAAARAVYDTRLRERRRQTQRIIKYIADDSVSAFNDFYAVYNTALTDWNNHHDAMAREILETTKCEVRFPRDASDARKQAIDPHFNLFVSLDGFSPYLEAQPGKAEKARERFLKESRFCPTYFLTKSSGHSVHSVFASMHKRIYNYREHDYTECRLRHRRNIQAYYQSCLGAESPSLQTECMRRFDQKIAAGSFCDKGEFKIGDFTIKDVEFNELDFYWGLGDRFFKTFRREFILDYCQGQIGFWGNALGWNCNVVVDDYLNKN